MTKIENNIEEVIRLVHEMMNHNRHITDDIEEMGSTIADIADMNSAVIGGDEDNVEIIG
jgi:hypothetical protein